MRSHADHVPLNRAHRVGAALLATLLVAGLCAPVLNVRSYIVPVGTTLPAFARVLGSLPIADALIISSPVAPAGAAEAETNLTFNALLDADSTGVTLDSGVAATGADVVWTQGHRGQGAVVALIDTGVAPVPALQEAVVGEIDFTGSGGGDGYGHGTFMASLVAGRGPLAPGVAPEAGIISLKVGGPDGATTLASVLQAMQWVHGPGRAAGVRIATLALGIDADSPAAALLDEAAARLAAVDVLVVSSSGNDGPDALTSPATSTGTFSVGAFADPATTGGTLVPAYFSGTGIDRAGVAQPDLLAPGVGIIGHMDPSALIATTYPTSVVEGGLVRGTGTSMATALAAGVAALASGAREDLGGTALGMALRTDAGVLNAPEAVAAALDALPDNGAGEHTPPGHAKRDNAHVPSGQVSRAQLAPAGFRWTGFRWTGSTWTGFRWTGFRWTGFRWTGFRWTAAEWNGHGWGDEHWALAHHGGIEWNGFRWTGFRWTGFRWTGDDWSGGEAFTGFRWTGFRWTASRWALLDGV